MNAESRTKSPTRRSLLGAAGAVVAVHASGILNSDRASAAHAVAGVRSAASFGAVGDGRTDDTAALQAGVDWSAKTLGTLEVGPGIYAISTLEVGSQVRVVGIGARTTLFPKTGKFAGTSFVPVDPSRTDSPLVTITRAASGASLENIVIDGYNYSWGGAPTDANSWAQRVGLSVAGGIEVRIAGVRVLRFVGHGIDVVALNNARWTDVFVDKCGTADAAAMRISSPADGATNFVIFDGLTIERAANTALSIGVGDDPVTDWASNITFFGLHVESNQDSAAPWPLNTSALIDIGNVRAISFVAPQILGAPAPMVRYRQRISPNVSVPGNPGGDARDQQGGVVIVGGQLNQHGGNTARSAAIELSGTGRGFSASGVKFATMVAPGVVIGDDFSAEADVWGCMFRDGGTKHVDPVVDKRKQSVRDYFANTVNGTLRVQSGDLVIAGTQIRVQSRRLDNDPNVTRVEKIDGGAVGAGWVDLGTRGPGTDIAGRLYLATPAGGTVKGDLLRVVFGRPFAAPPFVTITPRSAETATSGLYVKVDQADATTSGFTIACAHDVAPATTLFLDYLLIGKE